ncbi:Omp28-related outer membrane protein [Cryomorphaceae bacterium 1068]|nr:Omp28-related outer membrane protein [Cryomorphaceae bacterium 1068]
MKKIYLSAIVCLFATFTYAQSERLVLSEEGTNASCGPCAAQNPSFNALLDANTDNVISIKYQWYFPGFDPMHEHNPDEANARLAYYGINGVPTATIDGEIPDVSPSYAGAPGAFTQSLFDDAAAVPASFDIEADFTVSYSEISVNATATCTQAASGDLRLRIVVIEKEVLFDEAPGSNGETEFYNVMKKFLPNSDGLSMASAYESGDEFTASESWNLANIYDIEELAVVVFIQDDNTKEVLQAAYAETGEFISETENDAAGIAINNTSGENCSATFSPTVTIRNWGSETLTSLDVEYEIAGESNTIEWTGSIDFFETAEVELGEIATPTAQEEDLVVTLSNPNGQEDGNAVNDEIEATIANVPQAGTEIEVVIDTDNYGEETYWRVVDGDENVLGEGGNSWVGTTNIGVGGGAPTEGAGTYNSNQTYETTVTIPAGVDCYSFEIYDYYGDGICCQYGNGSYEVVDMASSETILEGGAFSAEEAKNFAAGVLSVDNVTSVNDFTMFPNPTNGLLNVEFNLVSSQRVSIDVLDLTGRLIISKDLGVLPAGYSLQQINLSGQSEGLYLLNMNVNDGRVVGKFTVNN